MLQADAALRPLAPAGEIRDGVATLAGVAAAALLFFALRNGYGSFLYRQPNDAWIVFVAAIALAVAFYRVEYRHAAGPLATITRGCAMAVVVFLVIEAPVLTLVNADNANAAAYVEHAWIPALALGILGAWRKPAFAIPAAFYTISVKHLANDISYFYVSSLDMRYVVDSAMFGAGMICAVFLIDRGVARRGVPVFSTPAFGAYWQRRRGDAINAAAMMAIGFHLANYFWSGVAKVELDGGPLTWVLENPTQNGIHNAIEKGSLPSAAWPWLTDIVYRLLGEGVLLLNVAVVVAQLAAVLLIFRIRWLLWLTYFYDLFHIGIYVFGGLFFWPWVWNNLAIVAALRHYRERPLGLTPKLAALAGILFGAWPQLGDAARLAWYEVTDIRSAHIEAETSDGTRIPVPPSFFMTHSYGVTHGIFDIAPAAGHYTFTLWGSAHSYQRLKDDGQCLTPAAGGASAAAHAAVADRRRRVRAFIEAHHAQMLERAERYGHLNFYFRVHHHPSNPLLFGDFNALDLKTVKRYVAVTESVCLRLVDGALKRTVLRGKEFPIDVRER